MAVKESVFRRLRDTAFKPQHDHRVSLQIFPDLNVEKIAADLKVSERGAERGAENAPPTSSASMDEVELQIVERMISAQKDASARLQEELSIYSERLKALDFEGRFLELGRAAPEAVSSFQAEAATGKDELNDLRRALWDAERERSDFQRRHGLTRAPRPATFAGSVLKVGLLMLLLLIETVVNGQFLAVGNLGGLLGGFTQAFGFALLNVGISFGLAYLLVRFWFVNGVIAKVVGGTAFVGYVAFSIGLNLGLAHFRDVSATMASDAGRLVITRLTNTPFGLTDIESWTFFGLGMMFSILSFLDGLWLGDPYPGYGAVEERRRKALLAYTGHKAALIERLSEIRDQTSDDIKDADRDLGARRAEHDGILDARARTLAAFGQFEKQVEVCGNALLQRYREANERKRTTKAPKHFAKPWTLERLAVAALPLEVASQNALTEQIKANREKLNEQIKGIYDEFTKVIESYRQIDDFVGDPNTAKPAINDGGA